MANSWGLVLCVLLVSLSVCCSISPQQQQGIEEQQAEVSSGIGVALGEGHLPPRAEETPNRGRIKREAADCPVSETQGGRIVDADAVSKHNFFIQPQKGFEKLEFRVKLDRKYLPGSWQFSRQSLVVTILQMDIDWAHPTWIPVDIEYYKKDIPYGPNPHTLRVKVGRNVNKELTTGWWRTHSYEGFVVNAVGPVKFRLKCDSRITAAQRVDDRGEAGQTLLIVCVLGFCFLLVVGAVVIYLIIVRRRRPQRDNQNDLPPVPTSLLRGSRVSRDCESENVYETIDEKTLAKFRQNLNSDSLAIGQTQPRNDCSGGLSEGLYQNATTTRDSAAPTCGSPGLPSGGARGMMVMSLLEEKEATREYFGLDSPLESHYVEMHGIVSRTSSLNK